MGNTTDATGKPVYDPTPNTVADLQAAVDFADLVGGLLKGTAAERGALTGSQSKVGWVFSETDTGKLYLRVPSGWYQLPAVKAGRVNTNTDSNGIITVTHGLGRVPVSAVATVDDSTPVVGNHLHVVTMDLTDTTFKIRFYRSGTVGGITYNNEPYAVNNVVASWMVAG